MRLYRRSRGGYILDKETLKALPEPEYVKVEKLNKTVKKGRKEKKEVDQRVIHYKNFKEDLKCLRKIWQELWEWYYRQLCS